MTSLNTILFLTVICVVVSIVNCERNFNRQYVRIKRGKYYSNPPPRFYSRPPAGPPSRGTFSYTPPPNYMADDDEPPYPGNYRPPKVSTRPAEGLGEEDLNNLVKYLSKQDLDKIIEYAGKGRYEKNNEYKSIRNEVTYDTDKPQSFDDDVIFKSIIQEVDNDLKASPYKLTETSNFATKPTASTFDYSSNTNIHPFEINQEAYDTKMPSYESKPTFGTIPTYETAYQTNLPTYETNQQTYDTKKSIYETNVPTYNTKANYETKVTAFDEQNGALYTDSRTMPEEALPRPINLREDDYEVSFTNNVAVVKSPSYEVKGFGDIPLMNFDSKLDTQSSYRVPHYTVTSPGRPSQSYSHIPLEPAPPPSAAKSQSDAHLKAIKIWSHKSQGTAYTLHDDGSLSLERPKQKYYGHP